VDKNKLKKLICKWQDEYFEYKDRKITGNLEWYVEEYDYDEVPDEIACDWEVVGNNMKIVEHVLAYCIERKIVKTLNQVKMFLNMQMYKKDKKYPRPLYRIDLNWDEARIFNYRVYLQDLTWFPFGEVFRCIQYEELNVGFLKGINKLQKKQTDELTRLIRSSFAEYFGEKMGLKYVWYVDGRYLCWDEISTTKKWLRKKRLRTIVQPYKIPTGRATTRDIMENVKQIIGW
jgi:hypothetical protein